MFSKSQSKQNLLQSIFIFKTNFNYLTGCFRKLYLRWHFINSNLKVCCPLCILIMKMTFWRNNLIILEILLCMVFKFLRICTCFHSFNIYLYNVLRAAWENVLRIVLQMFLVYLIFYKSYFVWVLKSDLFYLFSLVF